MKAAELKPGVEVAVTAGGASWDLRTKKATRAVVLKPPRAGHVEVRLLEDSNSGVGATGAGFGRRQAVNGDAIRVSTRQCWMLWGTLETRAANERENREREVRDQNARDDQLLALQHRVDQLAGEFDEQLGWAGYASRPDYTATVALPTAALEKLLDRAEGK